MLIEVLRMKVHVRLGFVEHFRFGDHLHGLLKSYFLSQAGVDDLHRFGRFTRTQLKSAC